MKKRCTTQVIREHTSLFQFLRQSTHKQRTKNNPILATNKRVPLHKYFRDKRKFTKD